MTGLLRRWWGRWFKEPGERCEHVLGEQCMLVKGHTTLHRTYDPIEKHGFSWPSYLSTNRDAG